MPRCFASERNYSQGWKGAEIGAFAAFLNDVFSEEVTGQVHNARPSSDFVYFMVTLIGKQSTHLKAYLSQVFSPSICLLQFLLALSKVVPLSLFHLFSDTVIYIGD